MKDAKLKATDWLALWAELVLKQRSYWDSRHSDRSAEVRQRKAREYDAKVEKRWGRPDTSRQCVLSTIGKSPGATVLDIGAGTGAWTLLLAPHVAKVTALEPSDAMADVLAEKVAARAIANVEIIRGQWPDADVAPHDFTIAAHSFYDCEKLRDWVERMAAVTRKTCFMLLRIALPDTPMAKAAARVWGQPHDSPNFQIAYNALLQMGICANVRVEADPWDPWRHDSLEKALEEVKARLGLTADSTHDRFLYELLEQSLVWEYGEYRWPIGTRSALVYWHSEPLRLQIPNVIAIS